MIVGEGPIQRTREGGSEWEPIKILFEGDGNSNKMNTASNTRLRLTTKVGQAHVATGVPLEGPIRRTREGGSEWEPIKILLEGDGNSNKMNTASNTRLRLTTKVGQAHVATEVPLNLGTNTPPSDPRNAAENQNSSLQTHTG
jgi:hypothetical protein